MSVELVMPSNHLTLCCPLLLLASIFSSIRVFSSESVLHIRWPKYWSFSFSISPSNDIQDWFPLGLTYWIALPILVGSPPGDLPNPGIKPRSPTLQANSLPAEPQGKPKNGGVGSLSLLQGIFPTQGSNPGLPHCRWILYQLSHKESPNGCESWTTKKAEHQRIDAFKLWHWRRLWRVPWTARRSNQSILKLSTLNTHWKDWCWSWSSSALATWCEAPNS